MSERDDVTRRRFLTVGGVSAIAAAGFPASLQAAWGSDSWTAEEQANVRVVSAFLGSWEHGGDANRMASLLAEDVVSRPTAHNQEAPPLEDREALRAFAANAFANGTVVEFKVLDTMATGPIVVNNRIDRLTREDGTATDVYYLGVFFLKDGKIAEWTDYSVAEGTPVTPGQPL